MSQKSVSPRDRRGRWIRWGAAISTLVLGWLLVASTGPNNRQSDWPVEFSSPGERLYFTGHGASGQRMTPRGGNHHMTMMGSGGCVDCHGADREGGRLWPSFWQVAPSIATADLVGDHAHDGHSHDSYTAETLARAITDGIRPDGSVLKGGMPRWSMSPTDLHALTDFLLST